MPRTARASFGEVSYHVLKRGNARRQVFHRDDGYQGFMEPIEDRVRPLRDAGASLVYHANLHKMRNYLFTRAKSKNLLRTRLTNT